MRGRSLWEPVYVKLRPGITAAHAVEKLGELKQALQTPRNLREEAAILPGQYEHGPAMSAKINGSPDVAQTVESHTRQMFPDTDLADGLFGERDWHIAGLKPG